MPPVLAPTRLVHAMHTHSLLQGSLCNPHLPNSDLRQHMSHSQPRSCMLPQTRRGTQSCCASADASDDATQDHPGVSWLDALPSADAVSKGGEQLVWRDELSSLASSLRSSQMQNSDFSWDDASASDSGEERVYLVGVEQTRHGKGSSKVMYSVEESLDELAKLADTAGLQVVGRTFQRLQQPDPRTYIGSGKTVEIQAAIADLGVQTVIFDDELSPGQQRTLEKVLGDGVRLCDRTALILDIFSQRAATREGHLQVQMAMSEYQLPRLTRMWSHLERQAGGGQVRGMGEKQLEVDKRLLRQRMSALRHELDEVKQHRRQYRARRAEAPVPVVAIVGYTNAGKSTLLCRLTDNPDTVLAEDKLFATLDPTTRRVMLPSGLEALFTDTVGFIQKLPTSLVAAFRATLEEINDATLLLHVVDVSQANAAAQVDAVMAVLNEVIVKPVPMLTVWNKVDACPEPEIVREVASRRSGTVAISALEDNDMTALVSAVELALQDRMTPAQVLIPYSKGDLVTAVHRLGVVEKKEFTADGTRLTAHLPSALSAQLQGLGLVEASPARNASNGAVNSVLFERAQSADKASERANIH